jgi:signal transduction histidine kinase
MLATAILAKQGSNQEFYDRIETEINRMDYLIKQILEFSRITTGKKILNKSNIQFNRWIKQLVKDCEFEAESHNKQISLIIDSDNIYVYACENIIGNAIRHTPKNSKIVISIIVKDASYIDIIVKDNGTGIPKEIMDTIFTPFIFSKKDKTRNFSNFGLGMSIAKEVIEMHNGSIFIENLFTGCEIILRLPLYLTDEDASFQS